MTNIEKYKKIISNFDILQAKYTMAVEEDKRLSDQLSDTQYKHRSKTNEAVLDTSSSEVVKQLFDIMSQSGFKFLEQLGTSALQTVFTDEVYEFKIHTGSRGSERTVEFYILSGGKETPLSETGGGVQCLISLVVRIFFIMKHKLRRFVVLDETLASISPQYQDSLLEFLQSLVDQLHFDFLIISHQSGLESKVTNVYECYKGRLKKRA
jgi:hypothetical protein